MIFKCILYYYQGNPYTHTFIISIKNTLSSGIFEEKKQHHIPRQVFFIIIYNKKKNPECCIYTRYK